MPRMDALPLPVLSLWTVDGRSPLPLPTVLERGCGRYPRSPSPNARHTATALLISLAYVSSIAWTDGDGGIAAAAIGWARHGKVRLTPLTGCFNSV